MVSTERVPTFKEFLKEIQARFTEAVPNSKIHADRNGVAVVAGENVTTLSLDRLYRFYVDDIASHPEFTRDQLHACLQMFVNHYLTSTGRKPLFHVNPSTASGCVLEQCCIR